MCGELFASVLSSYVFCGEGKQRLIFVGEGCKQQAKQVDDSLDHSSF